MFQILKNPINFYYLLYLHQRLVFYKQIIFDDFNCTQEEILMLIFPEALVCMLFVPPMRQNQAVLIQDLIKQNHYKGYEHSFKFVPQEINVRSFYNLLAIDSKHFSQFDNQFLEQNMNRELLKCYFGFEVALKNAPRFPTRRWMWYIQR